MQLHRFSDGGAVAHKIDGFRVSAWWNARGELIDCESTNGRGASHKPNQAMIAYLQSIGPAMIARANADDAESEPCPYHARDCA